MKINILLCDTFPGLLPSYIPDYPSMFTTLFDKVASNLSYSIYKIYEEEFPQTLCRDQLYLITGSNSGVYEPKTWILSLLEFIRKAHSEKVPLTGICFGHQAIAQALGGEVRRSEKGWGTGIRTAQFIHPQTSKWFPSGSMNLHYNHHDQVIRLPHEATLFATSPFCSYEGFMIGNHILTFQGHPEYTDTYNIHLLMNHSEDEPETVRRAALQSIEEKEHNGIIAARWILTLPSGNSNLFILTPKAGNPVTIRKGK
ncbi:MAG: type 1 glutamine amidotransferase [Bacteroides sp.]|nr:type 1 glutamine amidotransferase [Bacteroides sp.]